MQPERAVARLGGIARTRELLSAGCTRHSIALAVRSGQVVRIRVGWFALPGTADHVIRAHRVGGPPACATVAAAHGLWMLNQPLLHIVVAGHDSRFRSQLDSSVAIRIRDREDVVVHWVAAGAAENRMGEPLADALQHVAVCLPELDAICVLDSALHSKAVTRFRLQRGAGPAASRVLALCDGRAESGVETVFRLRASGAGYRFRCQVVAPGGGRFDFLFGDRLVVEVDGSEFHSGHAEFIRDRERDAWYAAIGYYVVRLTYAQVVHRWHEVESLLRLVLARGEHVWPARIRTPATSLGVSSVDRGAAGADSETAQKAGAGSRPQKAGHRAEPRAR